MIKCIIFDFNRTLYLPELQIIPGETLDLLRTLKKTGTLLALISIQEAGREDIVEKYGLSSIFSVMKFVDKKDIDVFNEVLGSIGCSAEETIVIGDRIKSEIKTGNMLGIRTVWYKNGKFSGEFPTNKNETPTFTISRLNLILEILNNINSGIFIEERDIKI